MEQVEFVKIITPLTVALGLALTVERVLEILKHLFEPFLRSGIVTFFSDPEKTRDAVADADRSLDKLARHATDDSDIAPIETTREANGDSDWEQGYTLSTVIAVPATDADDGTTLKAFFLQLFGFATGIVLARLFELQLFHIFVAPAGISISPSVDYLLTGLVLGGGSKHMHLLIRLMTRRRYKVDDTGQPADDSQAAEDKQDKEPAPAASPLPAVDQGDWVDIPYKGGVDREALAFKHRRPENPDLVVFHHTAMHSDATFEDVVQTIKKRNWSTGYHCVILKDGSIHPFCRWDRFGCHAKGHNLKSLGIAFNGNFEMGAVAGNNADGRYGLKAPTDSQIKSGARIVALWVHLYAAIDLNFDINIQPHRNLKATVCPGSGFPLDEFKNWVSYYVNQWETSPTARAKLAIFKEKPYIYV